jgi:hypothetical protein
MPSHWRSEYMQRENDNQFPSTQITISINHGFYICREGYRCPVTGGLNICRERTIEGYPVTGGLRIRWLEVRSLQRSERRRWKDKVLRWRSGSATGKWFYDGEAILRWRWGFATEMEFAGDQFRGLKRDAEFCGLPWEFDLGRGRRKREEGI